MLHKQEIVQASLSLSLYRAICGRTQIKALLKYNNVHIYHLLNIKRLILLKQRPVRCLRWGWGWFFTVRSCCVLDPVEYYSLRYWWWWFSFFYLQNCCRCVLFNSWIKIITYTNNIHHSLQPDHIMAAVCWLRYLRSENYIDTNMTMSLRWTHPLISFACEVWRFEIM